MGPYYTKEKLIEISVFSGCSDSQDSAEDFYNDDGIFFLPHPVTQKCTRYYVQGMQPSPTTGPGLGTAYAVEQAYILKTSGEGWSQNQSLVYAVPNAPFELNGKQYFAHDPSGRYLPNGAGFDPDSYKFDVTMGMWYKQWATVAEVEKAAQDAADAAAAQAAALIAQQEAAEAAEAAAAAEYQAILDANAAYAITADYRPLMPPGPDSGRNPNLINDNLAVMSDFKDHWASPQPGYELDPIHNELLRYGTTNDPFRALTGFLWCAETNQYGNFSLRQLRDAYGGLYKTQNQNNINGNMSFRILKRKPSDNSELIADRTLKKASIFNKTDNSPFTISDFKESVQPATETFCLRTEPRRLGGQGGQLTDDGPTGIELFYGEDISKLFNEDFNMAEAAWQTLHTALVDQHGGNNMTYSYSDVIEDPDDSLNVMASFLNDEYADFADQANRIAFDIKYSNKNPYPYTDFVTTYFNKDAVKKIGKEFSVEYEKRYNSVGQEYENLTSEGAVDHSLLPSYNAFTTERDRNILSDQVQIFKGDPNQFVTLSGRVQNVIGQIEPNAENVGRYFNKWTRAMNSLRDYWGDDIASFGGPLSKMYRNVIIPARTQSLLADEIERKSIFPMYFRMSLDLRNGRSFWNSYRAPALDGNGVEMNGTTYFDVLRQGVDTTRPGYGSPLALGLQDEIEKDATRFAYRHDYALMRRILMQQQIDGGPNYHTGTPASVGGNSTPGYAGGHGGKGHYDWNYGDNFKGGHSKGRRDFRLIGTNTSHLHTVDMLDFINWRQNLLNGGSHLYNYDSAYRAPGGYFGADYDHNLQAQHHVGLLLKPATQGVNTAIDEESFISNGVVNLAGAHQLDPAITATNSEMMPALLGLNELRDTTRNMEEIFAGHQAYSEIVFFRIRKTEGDGGEVLKDFYISCPNNKDALDFVDTQLKYGLKYTYDVTAWVMVYGTKYRYDKVEFHPYKISDTEIVAHEAVGDGTTYFPKDIFHELRVTVSSVPDIKLIELPYLSKTVRLMDSAPLAPEVEPYPYKGVNNKILWFIRNSTGEVQQRPVQILQSDNEFISEYIKSRLGLTLEEFENFESVKVTYRSDDLPAFFEVFRLETPPESYADFSDGKFERLSAAPSDGIGIIDDIEPNKKYYYTFRTIDVHDNISNPSSIYQMEMVDDGGAIYLKTEIYEFPKIEKIVSAPFRKMMFIKPNMIQSEFDEEESLDSISEGVPSAVTMNPKIGTAEESVFDENKLFKIRFKSRKTNKSIDLNLKCKIKKVPTNEEANASELKIEPYTSGLIVQSQHLKNYLDKQKQNNPELSIEQITKKLADAREQIVESVAPGAGSEEYIEDLQTTSQAAMEETLITTTEEAAPGGGPSAMTQAAYLLAQQAEADEAVSQATTTEEGGTVICTELNRQGHMPFADMAASKQFSDNNLDKFTMMGYHYWAKTVVRVMQKSPELTQLLSPIGLAWGAHMAYVMGARTEDNEVGKLISELGVPECQELGIMLATNDLYELEVPEEEVIKSFQSGRLESLVGVFNGDAEEIKQKIRQRLPDFFGDIKTVLETTINSDFAKKRTIYNDKLFISNHLLGE